VGDYAESIARHTLNLSSMGAAFPLERFAEIAHRSVPMLQDAVKAFVTEDPVGARSTIEIEDIVDVMRDDVNAELVSLHKSGSLPLDALSPLMAIINRLERVSDQAKSICQEVIYMCTGEHSKHLGGEAFRMLFVDEHNHCRSQMAEAIGNAFGLSRFVFSSAGLDPQPIDRGTLNYMKTKGLDLSRQTSKGLGQIPHLDQYQIVVALAKEAHRAFPSAPTKVVALDWSVPDPSAVEGSPAEIRAAFDRAFDHIRTHLDALVEAMIGEKLDHAP
jgi:arsenate reductase